MALDQVPKYLDSTTGRTMRLLRTALTNVRERAQASLDLMDRDQVPICMNALVADASEAAELARLLSTLTEMNRLTEGV